MDFQSAEVYTHLMKYIINTDGGSRGNPGPAAAAFIIKTSDGERINQKGIYMGIATNNEAEYLAVEKALEALILSNDDTSKIEVEIRADSQLVVKQLSNEWKIKNQRLKTYHQNIKELEAKMGKVDYVYIPRTQNFEADLIVNITLDSKV